MTWRRSSPSTFRPANARCWSTSWSSGMRSICGSAALSSTTHSACWDDYRRAIVRRVLSPVGLWSRGTPARTWWPALEHMTAAFHDLRCEEVVSPSGRVETMVYHPCGPIYHAVPSSMGRRKLWNAPPDARAGGLLYRVATAADRGDSPLHVSAIQ